MLSGIYCGRKRATGSYYEVEDAGFRVNLGFGAFIFEIMRIITINKESWEHSRDRRLNGTRVQIGLCRAHGVA